MSFIRTGCGIYLILMVKAKVFRESSISVETANCVIKSSLITINNNLRFAYFNARSLNMDNKFAEVLRLIDGVDLNIIAVTETWLKPWVSSNSISIPGFTLVRNDRSTHSGGVAIYVSNNLRWKILHKSDGGPIEFLFLEVTLIACKLLVGVVYNPKGGNVDLIENLFSAFITNYQKVLIAGDFNIDMLKSNSTTTSFKNVLNSQNLAYLPTDQPTRVCDFHSSASLLDIIITLDASLIEKFIQLDLSIFDHDLIYFSYSLPSPPLADLSFSYRSYKDLDYNSLFADCLDLNWKLLFDFHRIDDKVAVINEYLYYLFDKHVPLRNIVKTKRTTPVWFNASIQLAIFDREAAYRAWKNNKTPANRSKFIRARREVKKLIKITKGNYIYKLLDSGLPPRKLWSNIRHLGLSKDSPPNPQFSVNELNQFFVNSIPLQPMGPLPLADIDSFLPPKYIFNFDTVDEGTIQLAISSIKSNAIGHDGIPIRFIKLLMPLIIPFICHLINTCIADSVFPSQWKISKVIPIPKTLHPKVMSDMRPISILPVISKVIEIIMKNQITECLSRFNMFTPLQSGFRAKHSTTTAMLKITEDISSFLDENQVVFLVLLDFSKAFDTLRHEILLCKLRGLFNFSEEAIKLIHNYLMGRIQYVNYNDELSIPIKNTCGVPQGSVLGPLLFSIFINDIANAIDHCKYHLYADDLQIYLNSSVDLIDSVVLHINEDLFQISKWAKANCLVLNSSKSKVMRIYRGKINLPYPRFELNNELITYTNSASNLGFIITSELKWDLQVNRICSNIYGGLKRLSKFKNSTPIKTKKSLARSLLVSQILYSDLVIGTLDYDSSRRLQVAFNSITRYVYNVSRFEHITPYSKSLLGSTLNNYLKYRQCTLIFDIINGKCPDYLRNHIELTRSTRCVTLIPPRHRLTFRASFFFVNGAQTWNSLPLDLRRISHPTQFKVKCFEYFSER